MNMVGHASSHEQASPMSFQDTADVFEQTLPYRLIESWLTPFRAENQMIIQANE
jgi:hypothetical protein